MHDQAEPADEQHDGGVRAHPQHPYTITSREEWIEPRRERIPVCGGRGGRETTGP
jgi:hypothetical protein